MEAIAQRLVVIMFLLLMLALGVLSLKPVSGFTNMQSLTWTNGQWSQQFEQQYNKTFPAKNFGTALWAAIQYRLFHEGRNGVVVGQSDWLYSREEFNSYADFERQVARQFQRIVAIRDYLNRQGSELVMVIVPSKARVYQEFTGDHQPPIAQQQLYRQAQQFLADQHIFAPELLPSFLQQKPLQQLFFHTDTHWTPQGADLTAKILAANLPSRFSQIAWGSQSFITTRQEVIEHQGDLMNFIPLSPYFTTLGPDSETLQRYHTGAIHDEDTGLFSEPQVDIALVGTSYSANELWNFAGSLKQYLGVDLVNYAEEGKGPVIPMLDYLASEDFSQAPARLVIWEFPERYLPMLDELSDRQLPFAIIAGE